MARTRTKNVFVCAECQATHPRWTGRCSACGAWGTVDVDDRPSRAARPLEAVPEPARLGDAADPPPPRLRTGIDELDRVLGGGIVPGSLVLLGGEPGIGKSTLVLQALGALSASREVLLVTGEESLAQVRSRARRLSAFTTDRVGVIAETRLESVVAALDAHAPSVCAIDSIQTLVSDLVDGGPGSVSQVRQATAELMRVAKSRDIAIIIVGQVTKDGGIAGPRMLEHMVDCVLTFDGEEMRSLRMLRSLKNRFGSTNESGMMEMRAEGLVSVPDPSAHLLSEVGDRVGSWVFPAIEGSRALLVEVQALVGHTEVVPPRRVAVGVDRTRLAQVIAVLSRHAGLRLGDQDVFVSVAGGARALDPAADLAIALAIVSAHRGVPLTRGAAAFGEIGLTGGIRPSGHAARRLGAIAAQGLDLAVLPRMADDGVAAPKGLRLAAVPDIEAALEVGCRR